MQLRDAFDPPVPTMVLAEGKFGEPGGKTANGVVMHSEVFDAAVIVDSARAGSTADAVIDRDGVGATPIVASVEHALGTAPESRALVIGVAPPGGELPDAWIAEIEAAIAGGCDVVSGLHTFFGEDPRWRELADRHGVRLFDVRKPPADAYRVADGSVDEVGADVILTMGTDCAIGKRTTTYELYREAGRRGHDAAWVATGQTGIMVGAQRGVALDRVPSDFVAGVVEQMVVELGDEHELVFVEGQGSLTHRAYSGVTLGILHGAWPDAVVLVDDPSRDRRAYFEQWPLAGVREEIALIEQLSDATVAAISTWATEATGTDRPAGNVLDGGAATILEGIEAALSATHD